MSHPIRRAVIFAVLAMTIGEVPRAEATFDCYFSATQPVLVEDCGCYEIHTFTFHEMCGGSPAGYEVTLIERPGFLSRHGRFEDRNAAALAGIRITAELVHDWSRLPRDAAGQPYLDTLRVVLDAAAAYRQEAAGPTGRPSNLDAVADTLARRGHAEAALRVRTPTIVDPETRLNQADRLVRATLASIVDTAARSRVPVRHVRILVTGDPRRGSWSETHALADCSPAVRMQF